MTDLNTSAASIILIIILIFRRCNCKMKRQQHSDLIWVIFLDVSPKITYLHFANTIVSNI